MIELTTTVATPLGMWLVVLALPLLEDLPEAFNNEGRLLIIKLRGVYWKPHAWSGLFLFSFVALKAMACNLGVEVLL